MTRRYLNYRAWPQAWLSEVPAHWTTGSFRHYASFTTGWTPPTGDDAAYIGNNLWANIGDLKSKSISDTAKRLSDEAVEGQTPSQVGDLLFAFKLSVGAVAGVESPMFTNEAIATIHPSDSLDLGYGYYALPTFLPKNANTNIYGAPLLNSALIRSAAIALPPINEQRSIADFLDRETARIDALIVEQQQLIEMLNERRGAVVIEAVTKGLNSSVVLVDSGVDWIGKIPKEWSVKAIRRSGTLLTGSTPPTDDPNNFDEEANERPWVRPQDLRSDTKASAWLTPEGWGRLRPVPAGSVLVGCIAYSLGSVGYLSMEATTNQQITSIIPRDDDGRYLYYVMHAAKRELWAASQINRVPILNNERFGAIRIPVPPLDEQRRIASYLDNQTKKIDALIGETERFIELSRERRSALITAAVTGQMDARGEVA